MKEAVLGCGNTELPLPLSPVLLAGMALRPLPPTLMQPALHIAMTTIWRRHPEVFDRLSCLENPVFLIDPADLPLVFVLRTNSAEPSLMAARNADAIEATATVRGPLMALVSLLEGTSDGDALFFSRSLVVEGDTEAVVALRNAVDDAEIDLLEDLFSMFGPLAYPVRHVVDTIAEVALQTARNMETIYSVFISPAMHLDNIREMHPEGLDKKVDSQARGGHCLQIENHV